MGTSATEIVGDALFDNKGFISIDNLDINYIQSDAIYPLSFSGNHITEVAFAFSKSYKDTQIIDLRLHLLNKDGTYRIENHRYL